MVIQSPLYRTMELFGLEVTFKDHIVQLRCVGDIFHKTRLLKAQSNLTLNTANHGASTNSLGNLFQCLTILTVKKFFLMSNLDLLSFSLKLLPFVLPLQTLVKSISPSFLSAPSTY